MHDIRGRLSSAGPFFCPRLAQLSPFFLTSLSVCRISYPCKSCRVKCQRKAGVPANFGMLYTMLDVSANSHSLSKHAPDVQALQGSPNAQGTFLSWLEQLSKTRQWLSLEQTEGLAWRQGRPFFCSCWHHVSSMVV